MRTVGAAIGLLVSVSGIFAAVATVDDLESSRKDFAVAVRKA